MKRGSGAATLGSGTGGYVAIYQLSREISRAWNSEAAWAALTMVYVGIDTMALLACPLGKAEQTKGDFILWVDTYLRADPASDYQHEGADVYAARCALLHSYGSVARDHRGAEPPRKFGYTDNGPHRKDETARLVIISVAALIEDYYRATESFVRAFLRDPELKQRVDIGIPLPDMTMDQFMDIEDSWSTRKDRV